MDIKLFDNRILAPAKCGSRYLSKIFTSSRIVESIEVLSKKVTHIVVRHPLEHFQSAIHTEYYNNSETDLSVLINGSITNKGIGHWHPNTYKFLYNVLCTNKSIHIINLADLTDFLLSENYTIEYNESEYNWSESENWMNKNDLYNMIIGLYPYEMSIIKNKIDIEISYYNKLIYKEVTKSMI